MLGKYFAISIFSKRNVFIWLLMSFQAGTINTGGFLACHRFVSHTTGFATLFGSKVAQGNLTTAMGYLSVPLFFLFGSFISGLLVDRQLQRKKRPYYFLSFGIIAILMLVIILEGNSNQLGAFGDPANLFANYFLIASLCLASGIQNATITSASSTVIRTTHLTGITTDLGIGLTRVFTKSVDSESLKNEKKSNLLRVGIILSFAFGSAFSAFIFNRYNYNGFFIPLLISLCLAVVSFRATKTAALQKN